MPNYREERPGAGASSQEQPDPHYKTHQELVAAFRARIRTIEARIALQDPVPPEYWIRRDLIGKWVDSPYNSDKKRFFKPSPLPGTYSPMTVWNPALQTRTWQE